MMFFIIVSILIPFAIALGLILSQWPVTLGHSGGLDFTNQIKGSTDAPAPLGRQTMRDGYTLAYRHYPAIATADAPLVVMVHGSGWHGLQFDALAKELQPQAEVLVPDLRGHGAAPGRRGDIDYIGQFEDDLADLIAAHRKPGQKLVMLGHSSGGGLVVRFAGGTYGQMLDGAVLLAPFLKHDAPMTRENAGGWSYPLTRRIIGLSMLNSVGITALNALTIIQFNMPQVVLDGPLGDTATVQYSYRLNTSFAPRPDYLGNVAKLPIFLLIAGENDEAFDAALYEPVMTPANGLGRYAILDGVGHLDVVNAPESAGLIKRFLDDI